MTDQNREEARRIVEKFLRDHGYQVIGLSERGRSQDPRDATMELQDAIAAALAARSPAGPTDEFTIHHAAGLLTKLKEECEAQHTRAQDLEADVRALAEQLDKHRAATAMALKAAWDISQDWPGIDKSRKLLAETDEVLARPGVRRGREGGVEETHAR
jgi:hypothetical protein